MKYVPFPIVIGATTSPFRLFSDFQVLSFLDKKNLLQTLKADSWPVLSTTNNNNNDNNNNNNSYNSNDNNNKNRKANNKNRRNRYNQ